MWRSMSNKIQALGSHVTVDWSGENGCFLTWKFIILNSDFVVRLCWDGPFETEWLSWDSVDHLLGSSDQQGEMILGIFLLIFGHLDIDNDIDYKGGW